MDCSDLYLSRPPRTQTSLAPRRPGPGFPSCLICTSFTGFPSAGGAADVSFDINQGARPRPSAHNGVTPILSVVAPPHPHDRSAYSRLPIMELVCVAPQGEVLGPGRAASNSSGQRPRMSLPARNEVTTYSPGHADAFFAADPISVMATDHIPYSNPGAHRSRFRLSLSRLQRAHFSLRHRH